MGDSFFAGRQNCSLEKVTFVCHYIYMNKTLTILTLFVALLVGDTHADILKPTEEEKRKRLCAAVTHVPSEDVAYQPGVSVSGKMVAPADLNPSPVVAPETFSFPITRDMAGLLGGTFPTGPYEMEANLGTIDARRNATGGYDLYYNGQSLKPGWEAALAELCGEQEITVKP